MCDRGANAPDERAGSPGPGRKPKRAPVCGDTTQTAAEARGRKRPGRRLGDAFWLLALGRTALRLGDRTTRAPIQAVPLELYERVVADIACASLVRVLRTSPLRVLLTALLTLSVPASADTTIVHEYFVPSPQEDLQLSATTTDGQIAAAIETTSGVVAAPPDRAVPTTSVAYGGTSTPDSADATYQIDRNTTQPTVVGYDDPFRPTITPFKRLFAYDAVDPDLNLIVFDRSLHELSVDGEVGENDDQFYADLQVDLADGAAVRIPSVGPGARVLAARLTPEQPFQLLRDRADNWFIRGQRRIRVRLVMQLAIDRDAFGSPFADVSWQRLLRHVVPLPAAAQASADVVLSKLEISREQRPAEAVRALITHFRAFAPSSKLPTARGSAELYEELALSKKGVCRHRAYAFVLTALGLGIPARLVRNEAHAWVEVFDATTWHRIDLGGAASRLDFDMDRSIPTHHAPADPYSWPEGSDSGTDMAERAWAEQGLSGQGSPGQPPSGSSSAPGTSPSGGGWATPPGSAQPASPGYSSTNPTGSTNDGSDAGSADETGGVEKSPSTVTLTATQAAVHRGAPLALSGEVTADEAPCAFARVDVQLQLGDGPFIPIGALPADESGHFKGSVTVPLHVDVGDYRIIGSTPGVAQCGPSTSGPGTSRLRSAPDSGAH